MNDHRDDVDERLARMAREAFEVPQAPKAEMWDAIDDTRRARRGMKHLPRRRKWWVEVAGVAAVLLLGVMLGRATLSQSGSSPAEVATEDTGSSAREVFTMAARDHLRDSEQFLVEFRTGIFSGEAQFASSDAHDLIATTRLLLDSPASENIEMQELLLDLELVLIQIAQFGEDFGNAVGEEDLINEGMEESDVLPRLRLLIPEPLTEAEGAL